MNEVVIGFYKQAEEMGYSPETTYAILDQLNKVAIALQEYVEEAANASGNPVMYKQALAQELLEKDAIDNPFTGVADAGGGGPQSGIMGMLAGLKDNKHIGPLIQSLMQGGEAGGIVGGLGGGGLGLILSLLTGSNPLTGLLAGGALGGGLGAFGRKGYDAYQSHKANKGIDRVSDQQAAETVAPVQESLNDPITDSGAELGGQVMGQRPAPTGNFSVPTDLIGQSAQEQMFKDAPTDFNANIGRPSVEAIGTSQNQSMPNVSGLPGLNAALSGVPDLRQNNAGMLNDEINQANMASYNQEQAQYGVKQKAFQSLANRALTGGFDEAPAFKDYVQTGGPIVGSLNYAANRAGQGVSTVGQFGKALDETAANYGTNIANTAKAVPGAVASGAKAVGAVGGEMTKQFNQGLNSAGTGIGTGISNGIDVLSGGAQQPTKSQQMVRQLGQARPQAPTVPTMLPPAQQPQQQQGFNLLRR